MSRRQSIKTMHSITNSNFQIQITFYSVPCFLFSKLKYIQVIMFSEFFESTVRSQWNNSVIDQKTKIWPIIYMGHIIYDLYMVYIIKTILYRHSGELMIDLE